MMRFCGIVFWLSTVFAAAPVVAETAFPYRATVGVADAEVRSGPGDEYYATSKLARGATVEVYRHVEDRWCAIRPPKGSFCWVSARYVKKSDDPNLGTVTEADVPSRVGSSFGRQRHVVQVRLDAGETVEILGEQNNGGQTWYRIAPPAGEFRWIDRRLLANDPAVSGESDPPRESGAPPSESTSPNPPVLSPDKTAPLVPPEFQPVGKSSTGVDRNAEVPEPEPEPQTSRREQWHQAGAPDWREPSAGSPVAEREDVGTESLPQAPKTPTPNPSSATADLRPEDGGGRFGVGTEPAANTPLSSESDTIDGATQRAPKTEPGPAPVSESSRDRFGEERDAIEFSLSHMVSGEPGTWRFDALRRRATALLAAAPARDDRADVRQILAKIARFNELQHRRAALSGRRRLATATRQRDDSPYRPPYQPSYQPPTGVPIRPRFPAPQPSLAPAVGIPSPIAGEDEVQSPPVAAQRIPRAHGWASVPRPIATTDRPETSNRPGTGADRTKRLSPKQKTPTPNPSSATADLRPEDGGSRLGIGTKIDSPGDSPGRTDRRRASRPRGDVVQIPEDNEPLPDRSKRYDATGVLKRVGSRRREAPRFALVDSTGDITSFITPSPGINLQPFIGQRVGVFGTRGFMPEYRRPHVTAARVTSLDRSSRTRY